MKSILISFLFLVGALTVFSENTFHNPDKVYLHLDRSVYAQGDTVWIKAYAMQRGSNKPSDNSYAVHVQMINEDGVQVRSAKLLAVNGEAVGQIDLLGVQKPGYYQLVAHTGYMKNFDPRFFFKTTIEVRERVPRRTINTLFDQVRYDVGDTAEITFSVIDQNQSPVPKARFYFEYMVDGQSLSKRNVRCADDGTMTLKLPVVGDSLAQGAQLKLFYYATDQDVHRMSQEVYIPLKKKKIELSFFPEGGDMIEGLMSKVAFKAQDASGTPVDIKGELYHDGQVVNAVSSIHEGMGKMVLFPQSGSYTFRVTSPKGIDSIYQLPPVKSQGYKLSYLSQDDAVVNLTLAHNMGGNKSCRLWISQCDRLLSSYNLSVGEEQRVPISKASLPRGIVTFTISDAAGVPQAERLVYVEKESPQLMLKTPQKFYGQRQKVELSLQIDSLQIAHLSCTVIDSILAQSQNISSLNIIAYAEFDSELKGYIHNVDQYIGQGKKVSNIRDLLLMTHGWRHFSWFDNNKNLSEMTLHNFNRVFGEVTRLGKPYPHANIGAYMFGASIASSEFQSDENGRFYLDPDYQKRDYKDMIILATNKKKRSGVTLKIFNTDTLLYHSTLIANADNLKRVRQGGYVDEQNQDPSTVEVPFMTYNTHMLDEFEVSAERQTWDMSSYIKQSREMKMGDELTDFISFEWLLMQVSNEIVLEGGMYDGSLVVDPPDDLSDPLPNPTVKADRAVVRTSCADRPDVLDITSCNSSRLDEVLLVFDGEHNRPGAMIYLNDERIGYFLSSMDFLTKEDVSAVVLFDGVDGYERFGVEAYYGAIMVYTYDKDIWNKNRLKSNQALFGNFVKARRFAEQLYNTELQDKTTAEDNRVTLHWEPLLQTDQNGQAKLSFFTGDIPGKKEIIVQGFDDEGNLYYKTSSFVVEDFLAR